MTSVPELKLPYCKYLSVTHQEEWLQRGRCSTSFNPIIPNRLFYLNSLDQSISSRRNVWIIFLLLLCFKEIPAFNANSAGPDQTPQNVASDLGLHCLPLSLLRDARFKWIDEDSFCVYLFPFQHIKNISEDIQEMPQSRNTALLRHQKERGMRNK